MESFKYKCLRAKPRKHRAGRKTREARENYHLRKTKNLLLKTKPRIISNKRVQAYISIVDKIIFMKLIQLEPSSGDSNVQPEPIHLVKTVDKGIIKLLDEYHDVKEKLFNSLVRQTPEQLMDIENYLSSLDS